MALKGHKPKLLETNTNWLIYINNLILLFFVAYLVFHILLLQNRIKLNWSSRQRHKKEESRNKIQISIIYSRPVCIDVMHCMCYGQNYRMEMPHVFRLVFSQFVAFLKKKCMLKSLTSS